MTILEGHGRVARATLASHLSGSPVFRTVADLRKSTDLLAWFGRSFVRKGEGKVAPAPDDPKLQAFAVREIESHPYAIVVKGKLCGMFQRGDEAKRRAANMGPNAEVWHLGWTIREVKGADVMVNRPDRVRGRSSVLNGSTVRVHRTFIEDKFSAVCVWTPRADREWMPRTYRAA